MIAFPAMLVSPAMEAGMKVPDDIDNYDRNDFPHWFVYTMMQIGQPLPSPTSHWNNAHIVASFPEDKIRVSTFDDFINAGFEVGIPIP